MKERKKSRVCFHCISPFPAFGYFFVWFGRSLFLYVNTFGWDGWLKWKKELLLRPLWQFTVNKSRTKKLFSLQVSKALKRLIGWIQYGSFSLQSLLCFYFPERFCDFYGKNCNWKGKKRDFDQKFPRNAKKKAYRPKYQRKNLTKSALEWEGQNLSNFFVGILVKTMTPKGHFEIN